MKRAVIRGCNRLGERAESRLYDPWFELELPEVIVGSIVLLTPTFLGDRDRFELLRASLLAAGCEIRHVAVVYTEDLGRFEALVRDDPLLELRTTAELFASSTSPRSSFPQRRGSN